MLEKYASAIFPYKALLNISKEILLVHLPYRNIDIIVIHYTHARYLLYPVQVDKIGTVNPHERG